MEYVYNDEVKKQLNELSKESIKELIEQRDKIAYEVLQQLRENHEKVKELRRDIDEILSPLPEQKSKELNDILDKLYNYMNERKQLQTRLFNIGNFYGDKISKQIDILEKYGISVNEQLHEVTTSVESNIYICRACKIKFTADMKDIKECPYCGSKIIVRKNDE
jgi:DNA-directed RNA polymerase subunit RPC12/RpoP/ribosomal protein L29